MRRSEKTNVNEWLDVLDKASKGSHYSALFKRVHKLLQIPSRSKKAVSIYKINASTKDGDNVLVPRKVLSTGALDHKISIAALEYSAGALKALKSAGCNIVTIKEMSERNRINLII